MFAYAVDNLNRLEDFDSGEMLPQIDGRLQELGPARPPAPGTEDRLAGDDLPQPDMLRAGGESPEPVDYDAGAAGGLAARPAGGAIAAVAAGAAAVARRRPHGVLLLRRLHAGRGGLAARPVRLGPGQHAGRPPAGQEAVRLDGPQHPARPGLRSEPRRRCCPGRRCCWATERRWSGPGCSCSWRGSKGSMRPCWPATRGGAGKPAAEKKDAGGDAAAVPLVDL